MPPLPKTDQTRGANEWLPAADELKAFKVDPRFEVNLFAGEEQFPEIANPIQMRFDTRGRLWVSCSNTYPHVYPGNEPRDKLVILEDTDRDGRADKSTIFADDLHVPLSFEFGDGGVYRLRHAESDVPQGHRRRRQGRPATGPAQRLWHRGLAPRPARFHLDARRRSALPRIDLSSFAGRNALRPRPAAKQRLVPLSAATRTG